MNRFEKISFNEFDNAMVNEYHDWLELCDNENISLWPAMEKDVYDNIILPERATAGSAGYDIHTPFAFDMKPGESMTVLTGIRALIDPGCFLMIVPRSGLGFKYGIGLANTVGIVDSDYSDSDNEGHIYIKLVNRGDKTVSFNDGDRIAQGIFLPYAITDDDKAVASRNGGFGSTGE